VSFSAARLGVDADLIGLYRERQQSISEHQLAIAGYLGLHHFGEAEAAQVERFVLEESWHLEQTAALKAQALKEPEARQSTVALCLLSAARIPAFATAEGDSLPKVAPPGNREGRCVCEPATDPRASRSTGSWCANSMTR
jgi:uncharacterized protein DUF4158